LHISLIKAVLESCSYTGTCPTSFYDKWVKLHADIKTCCMGLYTEPGG